MKLHNYSEKQIEQIIAYMTRPQEASLWGQVETIVPALVSQIHGDGMQLVHLTPIDTRPNYYILRIDSSIVCDDDDSLNEEDKSECGTVWEMLLRMIEDQYGNINSYQENEDGLYFDPNDDEIEPFEYDFPMLSWGGGSWGVMYDIDVSEIPGYES